VFVVIFRAKIKQLDEEYSTTAARMRELALTEFGCLEFAAVTEGDTEVALSYWSTETQIIAWKNHPEHIAAQQKGRKHWYQHYSVQIAEIGRSYTSAPI
jgi:heme-degrading monooxygenase HmoA